MVDSIAALHTQSAGFGKAQESISNTLAILAENVAKLVAGLPATQSAVIPATAPVPQAAASQEAAGADPPSAATPVINGPRVSVAVADGYRAY